MAEAGEGNVKHEGSVTTFAILFIYHDNIELCLQRIALLRRLNPGVALYGLFGGCQEDIPKTQAVAAVLDDHWIHPRTAPEAAKWKWKNTDIVVIDWFQSRGQHLPWDYVLMNSWDMVYLEPVKRYFDQMTSPNQVLIYPQEHDLEVMRAANWCWVDSWRPDYAGFVQHIQAEYGPEAQMVGTPMLILLFSRALLPAIGEHIRNAPGMLEYRFLTLVRLHGFEVMTPPHLPPVDPPLNWPAFANTEKKEVTLETVLGYFQQEELFDAGTGPIRIFHPVYDAFEFADYFEVDAAGKVQVLPRWKTPPAR